MNTQYKELLPANFAGDSRVWIYQANRPFSISEALQIGELLQAFVVDWKSHGTPVKGYGNLFFGQFIVLMADESASGVSGCSTDGSVRVIKEIEQRFDVNMFDRQLLAFLIKDKIELLPLSQIHYAVEKNFIDGNTLYFNNTVQTRQEVEDNWVVPAKNSWLAKKTPFTNKVIS